MSSIEANSTKVPPPKPFRRRLSIRTKPFSSPESDSSSSIGNTLGNGLNSVRGSIRRLRRVSNTVNGTSNTPTSHRSDNGDSNSTEQPTTNVQSPTFPSFQRLQTLASMAREQTSRLKEINITQKTVDLTAAVQEMSSEIGKRGVELGSFAKEVVVDRWKKKKEEPPNELLSPHNSKFKNGECINIFGESLVTAVRLTRIEKDVNQIENDTTRYWLPAIMVRCIEFLDKYGLEEVGLYRIPGSTLTVSRLKGIFNSGADLNFLQSSPLEDPHAVATLLKMYLREIPEPILTEALLPEFKACVINHTNSAVVDPGSPPVPTTSYYTAPTLVSEELPKALSNIVSRLPPQNFYLLRALFSHLSRVDRKHGINRMNISNLGLIFRPNLGIGSILFKVFVEHVDIIFGVGCKTENDALDEEKTAKEEHAPEIYHKTNISEDFTKSFEDLLIIDTEHVNGHSSNHSYSSSSSSSITGLYVKKDTVILSDENKNDSVKDYLINNTTTTISTIKPSSPTPSSSSITSPSTPPFKPTKDQQNNDDSKDTNDSFNEDELLSLSLNNHNKYQRSVNIIDTANKPTSSTLSNNSFRMRSRSTGLRNIPLTALEHSSDSSKEEKDQEEEDVKLPTLMTFDYIDKYGTKNLGVLNISARSSNWVHGNGLRDDRSKAAAAWMERRPSLGETEKWKRTLLNSNTTDPPNNVDDDTVIHEENLVNEKSKKVGKSKIRDQILKFNGAS